MKTTTAARGWTARAVDNIFHQLDNSSTITLDELYVALCKVEETDKGEKTEEDTPADTIKIQNKGAFQTQLRRGALDEVEYHVEDYYWKDGQCQWLASHDIFQNFTLGVIVANASPLHGAMTN